MAGAAGWGRTRRVTGRAARAGTVSVVAQGAGSVDTQEGEEEAVLEERGEGGGHWKMTIGAAAFAKWSGKSSAAGGWLRHGGGCGAAGVGADRGLLKVGRPRNHSENIRQFCQSDCHAPKVGQGWCFLDTGRRTV